MTQEQKSRAYDEALNKIKPLYEQAKKDGNPIWSTYEYLIPQLAESEDERIREAIEGAIRVYGKTQGEWIGGYDMDTLVVHLREAFGALEKQKEQKPNYCHYGGDPSVERCKYCSAACSARLTEEQKPAEWSEEEKRKLNRIYSIIGWAMDEHAFSSCKKLLGDKEGIELQNFLRSIAKPKQEYSEEDETMLKWIEDILLIADGDLSDKLNGKVRPITDSAYSSMKLCIAKCLSWLKSLRPQIIDCAPLYTIEQVDEKIREAQEWKPSEEQMNALLNAEGFLRAGLQHDSAKTIAELYEQLKQL